MITTIFYIRTLRSHLFDEYFMKTEADVCIFAVVVDLRPVTPVTTRHFTSHHLQSLIELVRVLAPCSLYRSDFLVSQTRSSTCRHLWSTRRWCRRAEVVFLEPPSNVRRSCFPELDPLSVVNYCSRDNSPSVIRNSVMSSQIQDFRGSHVLNS